MDPLAVWFLIIGLLLVGMALAATLVKRWPVTTSMLYLGVGVLLGPGLGGLLRIDPLAHSTLIERLAEVAVIISLFTAGLKLRIRLSDRRWWIALRLAVVSMTITVGLVTAAVVVGLGLPWGVGVLLGAVLAPTDPVLASDVQVEHPFDDNRLRFALTGEASLNDGTAFPILMLGLGLLGLHDIGDAGWRWLAIDVVWAVAAGLAIGGALGTAVGKVVLYLRRAHKEAVGLDDFLALGLIALSYGAALAAHGYGFLAVFAAGLALRRVERLASNEKPAKSIEVLAQSAAADEIATDVEQAPAYMAGAVLAFNEQLERIGELSVVVTVGAMLLAGGIPRDALWFCPLLLLVIRPLSVGVGLLGADFSRRERLLSAWFGIRGIGSVYYLMYAVNHGLPAEYHATVIGLTLATIAVSVTAHGTTVTPMMNRWGEVRPPTASAR